MGYASSPLSASEIAVRLLAVLLLVALNAFFVAAEFSIVSVRRSRINQLASGGDIQAKTVQSLQQSIDRLLSTTQLGITLSSLALGWIGEDTVAVALVIGFSRLSFRPQVAYFLAHSAAFPLAFLLIAYLQIVLGELVPKSLARIYPEKISRILGPTSLTISRLFTPFIWILNQSTRFLLRLMGVQDQGDGYTRLTPEELQLIISTSTETPDLVQEEREILNNIFEFRDVTVEEIMVPRTRIAAIEESATFQELLDQIAVSGHSRYPVIGESLDDIRGIIHFKELADPLANHQLRPHTPIYPWIRSARFVPDDLPLNELLARMQQLGHAMMVVVDDFGGTAGLVTLKDLIAEIIGDIHAPSPEPSDRLVALDDHTVLVPAHTDIEVVNQQLGLALPITEDYQTLAGFVIFHLQKIPQAGEQLEYQGLELTVTVVDGPRLQQIQVKSKAPLLLDRAPATAADLSSVSGAGS
jgi:CBS domain containing-hemolysin-like protein